MSLLADQLLEQAHVLATLEPGRPRQASLRRAVSTAYYALFHHLVDAAVREVAGSGRDARALRHSLARAFDHATMREACLGFGAAPRRMPPVIQNCLDDGRLQPELRAIALAFTELQALRHSADYDVGTSWARRTALDAVWKARLAMDAWRRIDGTAQSRTFLVSLLAWRGLRGR